jgi:hypothetical protein
MLSISGTTVMLQIVVVHGCRDRVWLELLVPVRVMSVRVVLLRMHAVRLLLIMLLLLL